MFYSFFNRLKENFYSIKKTCRYENYISFEYDKCLYYY